MKNRMSFFLLCFINLPLLTLSTIKHVLRDCKGPKEVLCYDSGLLTQVNYSDQYSYGGLKGWSLNTSSLKGWVGFVLFNPPGFSKDIQCHI